MVWYQIRRVTRSNTLVRRSLSLLPSQKSERSCTRVLEVDMLSVPSQKSERSCTRVLDVVILSVPSQKNERSNTRVLEVVILSVPSWIRVQEC